MRHIDEYRDPAAVRACAGRIRRAVARPWTIMEVCGGQTHAIVRFGIDELLPPELTLIHGPGCPVCVTPLELIDQAQAIAARPEVVFCTFGDMLRVPGSAGDLFGVRASGGDVRIVYSPLDAVGVARDNPARQVVFFAIGFETTAPATALAARQARAEGLANFSLLVAHVRVVPAMRAVLSAPGCRVQGFLAAGHVCAVEGMAEYEPLSREFGVPIVATGFEPLDLLLGLLAVVEQLEAGQARVDVQYRRGVRREGNPRAREAVGSVYRIVDRNWRGIGSIPGSGLALNEAYAELDAARRFDVGHIATHEAAECIAGAVLQGLSKPHECPAFGTRCSPESPLGAPMVSAEGACAAYYRYRRGAAGSGARA